MIKCRKLLAYCLTLYLFFLLLAGASTAETDLKSDRPISEEDLQSALNEVSIYFQEGISNEIEKHPKLFFEKSANTEIFVVDNVGVHFKKFAMAVKSRNDFQLELFTYKYLIPRYLILLQESIYMRRKEYDGDLGPLGALNIESESPFLAWIYNHTMGEQEGHSDYTKKAVERLQGEVLFASLAQEYFMAATQSPDLYRWEESVFHAHSPDVEECNDIKKITGECYDKTRVGRKEYGEARFKKHITLIFEKFLVALKDRSEARAFLWLGVLSHTVQDLVFHSGMTLSEHAALAYVERKNPDFPSEPQLGQMKDKAIENTIKMIQMAKSLAGRCSWEFLQNWQGLSKKSFYVDAPIYYKVNANDPNVEQDLTWTSLAQYMSTSVNYLPGGSKYQEFYDPSGNAQVLQWDSEALMRDIVIEVMGNNTLLDHSNMVNQVCKREETRDS